MGGALYAAWQDDTSSHTEIYAAKFDGNNWVVAGTGSNTGGGISNTHGSATRPQLAAVGTRMYVAWLDDRIVSLTGNATALLPTYRAPSKHPSNNRVTQRVC